MTAKTSSFIHTNSKYTKMEADFVPFPLFILFLFFGIFSDPPGPPYIEGYTQGETLRRGQTVELVCRSRGGNPPAQLIWYKNNTQVQMGYRLVFELE